MSVVDDARTGYSHQVAHMYQEKPRASVPPRRELVVDQYTLAHQAAAEEKQAAERFEKYAESANDRKDYRNAYHHWDSVVRAISNSTRHRQAELAMRKQEYTLYNHLDDDHVRQGLLLLIGYCERRIERLRDDSAKALCKARIAHLRCKILDIEWSAKMMQQQIIEEDLEGRARARPNGSFGASWKQGEGAWNGPPVHRSLDDASNKLRFLKGRIIGSSRIIDQKTHELQQNEDAWEAIRDKAARREPEWRRLDAEARSHWSAPVQAPPAGRPRQIQQTRNVDMELDLDHQPARHQTEADVRIGDAAPELQAMSSSQAQAEQSQETQRAETQDDEEWEVEYGKAFEEDPDFLAPATRGVSALQLGDTEADVVGPVEVQNAEIDAQAPLQHPQGASSTSDNVVPESPPEEAPLPLPQDGEVVINYDEEL